MSAYLIVDLEILDPAGFEEYKKRGLPIVEKYDGKYIVAGGRIEPSKIRHRATKTRMILVDGVR